MTSCNEVRYNFRMGCPSSRHLQQAAECLQQATNTLLADSSSEGSVHLGYGHSQGCLFYRDQLARFLSTAYGDQVKSSRLCLTAGATHGLHLVCSLFFRTGSPVFMVEPVYYYATTLLQDLHMNIIPVGSDMEGVKLDDLELLLKTHLTHAGSSSSPYRALLYLATVYSNPTGTCLPTARCKKLVELARKYNVLIFSDDVYNLLHYDVHTQPPSRLLAYDHGDADGGGHVISNGTFSKLLCPGIRVGWIEAGDTVMKVLCKSSVLHSGGAVNHYSSQLVATALKYGILQRHLTQINTDLQANMCAAWSVLQEHLPSHISIIKPQGGYYLWVKFTEDLDTSSLANWMHKTHGITFLHGNKCSLRGGFERCLRLSVTMMDKEELCEGLKIFCSAVQDFIKHPPSQQHLEEHSDVE